MHPETRISGVTKPDSYGLDIVGSAKTETRRLLGDMGEPVADQRQGQFRVGIVDTGHRTQIEGLPESAASINMASERIPRHMEYIRNLVEAMLDLLEIILNLPAARNRDLVALLAIGCLVALSLLRVMAAARNLLARVRARGRHARHNVREGGKGRQSRIARHARRGRTRLKIRFEVEHEHEREE